MEHLSVSTPCLLCALQPTLLSFWSMPTVMPVWEGATWQLQGIVVVVAAVAVGVDVDESVVRAWMWMKV